jgi:hypothetical protein
MELLTADYFELKDILEEPQEQGLSLIFSCPCGPSALQVVIETRIPLPWAGHIN